MVAAIAVSLTYALCWPSEPSEPLIFCGSIRDRLGREFIQAHVLADLSATRAAAVLTPMTVRTGWPQRLADRCVSFNRRLMALNTGKSQQNDIGSGDVSSDSCVTEVTSTSTESLMSVQRL